MLPKDFRGYLDYLEANGKLLRVKKEVDVKYEIAAGIRKISDNDGPVLLFENIKGYPGWKVAGGLYGNRKLMALALETEPDDRKMFQRYLDADQNGIKPKLVSTGPVKEIVIKGDDVDLTKLPVPTYCEKDVGPYIIAGAEIARHPETGVQNATCTRHQVLGKDRMAIDSPSPTHTGLIVTSNEARGQGTGLATVLGCPPELTLATQMRPPLGVDETDLAGALRGEPIEMVKCETIDVDVPAHAEIIIEGVTIPGERHIDGPYGEVNGDYISIGGKLGHNCFVIKVTAITMRENPIYQAIASGMPMTENQWLKKWADAVTAYRAACAVAPSPDYIMGVNLPEPFGSGQTVVSICKWSERAPKDIIYALLTKWSKFVAVVDDDVDVYDSREVARACATNTGPKTSTCTGTRSCTGES